MDQNAFKIIQLLLEVAAIVIGAYVAPPVKRFLLEITPAIIQYIKDKKIDTIITKAVYAAQQLLGDKTGTERKSFAMKYAAELLQKSGINLDEGEISSLIEPAVKALRIAEAGAATSQAASSAVDALAKKFTDALAKEAEHDK